MTITDAVVPVGGLGTRLLPATRSQPKEMLPVVDKPVVQYVFEELREAGVRRVLFVTGRRKRAIEDHFDLDPDLDRDSDVDPRGGIEVLYTRQLRPRGLGDALRYAEGFWTGEGVAVALGDTIIDSDTSAGKGILSRLIGAYEEHRPAAVIAVEEVSDDEVSRYGIAIPRGGSTSAVIELEDVIEKPKPEEVSSRMAVAARYVFGAPVFDALRSTKPDPSGEVQLADALRRVISEGGRVLAVPLSPDERRHDIGTVEGYCAAFVERALKDPRFGPAMRERARTLLEHR